MKRMSGKRPTVTSRRAVPGTNSLDASSGTVRLAASSAPERMVVRAGRGERTGRLAVSAERSPLPETATANSATPSASPAVTGKATVAAAPLAMATFRVGSAARAGPDAVREMAKEPSLPVSLRTVTGMSATSPKARKRGKEGSSTSGLLTNVLASAAAKRRPETPAAMSRTWPWNSGMSKETCALPEGPTDTGPDQ